MAKKRLSVTLPGNLDTFIKFVSEVYEVPEAEAFRICLNIVQESVIYVPEGQHNPRILEMRQKYQEWSKRA